MSAGFCDSFNPCGNPSMGGVDMRKGIGERGDMGEGDMREEQGEEVRKREIW